MLAATLADRDREPRVDTVSADGLSARRIAAPADSVADAAISIVGCGRPLPGHALRIIREDGADARDREVGEIALAGPSVMVGYYRDPELTSRVVLDGWLHTGDLGYLSEGELFVCGRVKDLIVINGRKYHPQDLGVESRWAVRGVRRGRVVAFGDAGANRVVIVAEASGAVAPGSLTADIRRLIGDHFGLAVDDVLLVPGGTVARTTSGKVRRAAMRTAYERGELASRRHLP